MLYYSVPGHQFSTTCETPFGPFGCNWLHFEPLPYLKTKALLHCVRRFDQRVEPFDGPALRRGNQLLVDVLSRARSAVAQQPLGVFDVDSRLL